MVKIAKYIDSQSIAFLDVESREEALTQLVDLLQAHQKLVDKKKFLKALNERENIVSTGIGMGVAIPHAKLSIYNDFFIGIGILKKGVDWDAMDESPVRLIFMIGGPDDKQTEYLRILSGLTQAIKDEDRRKQILNSTSVDVILDLLKEF